MGEVAQEGDLWDASNMNDMETRIENGFTEAKEDTNQAENNAKEYARTYADGVSNAMRQVINNVYNELFRKFQLLYTWADAQQEWSLVLSKTPGTDKGAITITPSEIANKIEEVRTVFINVDIESRLDDGRTISCGVSKVYPLTMIYDKATSKFKDFLEFIEFPNTTPIGGHVSIGGTANSNFMQCTVENAPTVGIIRKVTIYGLGRNVISFIM